MAWLQQQLTRERPDTFTQTAPDRNPNPLQRRGGPYIFSQDVLQHRLVQRQIRHHTLQLRVLVLKLLQPPDLAHTHAGIDFLPSNGMDGSPSTIQAESLQEEGELQ